jgi:isochorismate synthase
MKNKTKIAAILDQLLERHIAFAAWFFPKDSRMGLLVGNSSDVEFFKDFNRLNGEAGFVFAPYRITDQSPVILLKPKVYLEDFYSEDQLDIESLEPFEPVQETEACKIQPKEDYLKLIGETIAAIREGALSKVIISRQMPAKRTDTSLGTTFLQLQDQTPNAFTFLVNLPVAGTWMGATPEVLIQSDGQNFETVSLAGTQVRNPDAEEYYWSTKDIEEQAFVSRYMLDIFFNFDIHQYKVIGPETMESGSVAHLKTSFFFPVHKIADCLGNFIADLHPTPAVCGLPKDLAAEFILNNEAHERKYYTGYLGLWRLNQQVSLYVNLRSMEITHEEYILYAGGGITARSVPEKEWDETNQKAKTLLSVISPESPLPVPPQGEGLVQ